MNRSRALNNQTPKSLFQRFMGKLCPIPLLRDPDSYAKLKNTHSIHLDLIKTASPTSHHSLQYALTQGPSKTLLD
jgi:hypothetical protein